MGIVTSDDVLNKMYELIDRGKLSIGAIRGGGGYFINFYDRLKPSSLFMCDGEDVETCVNLAYRHVFP